jgi:hypothetical protein
MSDQIITKVKTTVDKRKATIAAKRQAKEAKKDANIQKFTEKHPTIFNQIKDKKNIDPYSKVIRSLQKDHKDISFVKTGIRYKGRDTFEITIRQNKMNQADIMKSANKISHMLGKYDRKGMIDLTVGGDQWYYQGQTEWGNDVVFRDDYDEINGDEFDVAIFTVSAMPGFAGGSSNSNDCLYNCLYDILESKLF